MKNINYIIGQNLSSIRKEKGLSLEQISQQCNISISHLKNIENGNRGLTIDSLDLFLNILNINYFEFFNRIKSRE